ncbi:aspartate dehydrogenase [Stappia sp. 28M-7]|uniref:aspartate dehydrogenase n=1 Tax=Stappia sp. 28M-7 TaxID=2762596 RepID=UPI00163B9ADC|nr:aspartate dehydrogenase [Stappia sp. 28M-7]
MTANIAIIGFGGITRTLLASLAGNKAVRVKNIVVRPERIGAPDHSWQDARFVGSIGELDADVDTVIEAAGHAGLRQHAGDVVASGGRLVLASSGALADDAFRKGLEATARETGAEIHVVSGAIGALDALATAQIAGRQAVRYTGIKPSRAWRGTPAEQCVDLDALSAPTTFFTGSAREVAQLYPANANVAATVALAGPGFDETTVSLIADPGAVINRHVVEADGVLGSFRFETTATPLSINPRTSGTTVFSILSFLNSGSNSVRLV